MRINTDVTLGQSSQANFIRRRNLEFGRSTLSFYLMCLKVVVDKKTEPV